MQVYLITYLEYIKENNLFDDTDHIGKFSGMDAKQQAIFMRRFTERYSSAEIKKFLYAANPEGWSREILERFDVIHSCYNHRRMGFAIIAEAKPASAVLQQVMADAFGIKNMVHCPLNEDEETIREAAESLQLYSDVFGAKNLLHTIESVEREGGALPPLFYAVMDPQSDSHKSYSLNIKFLQRATDQELIDVAIRPVIENVKVGKLTESEKRKLEDKFVPILRKVGTGASTARGGFSPKVVPRLFLNALSDAGYDLDNIPDEIRPVLKQMVSFVSTTIQGRDITLRMGTAEVVQDLIEDVAQECRAACLMIDGKFKGYSTVIAQPAVKYSPKMRLAMEDIAQKARDEFFEMRKRPYQSRGPDFNRNILDVFIDRVSASVVALFTGTGARPAARVASTAKKTKEVGKKANDRSACHWVQ